MKKEKIKKESSAKKSLYESYNQKVPYSEKLQEKINSLEYSDILEFFEDVITDNWWVNFIRNDMENKNFYLNLMNIEGWIFSYLPEKFKTKELYLKHIRKNPDQLKYNPSFIPKEFIDYELYLTAVEFSRWAFSEVPKHLITYELCSVAVKAHGEIIEKIPREFIDYDLCLLAVSSNGFALCYVPEEFIDYKICLLAVENDGNIYCVPDEFKDYAVCLRGIKNIVDTYIENKSKVKIDKRYKKIANDDYDHILFSLKVVPDNLREKIIEDLNLNTIL